jgi:hypothetical protein
VQTKVFHVLAVFLTVGIVMASTAMAGNIEITPFAGYTGGGDYP